MQALTIVRLGSDKRGTPRVWLHGRRLTAAGFTPAARYEVSVDPAARAITLRLAANGERLVSRKMRGDDELPVIDLVNAKLFKAFEGLETVKVTFSPGSVTITPTANDLRRLDRLARLKSKLDSSTPLAVGSVSTGLGVLALAMHEGLEAAGLASQLKFAVDIEPAYLEQCSKANPVWTPDTVAIEAPMQALAFDATALAALPKVEILEAGIPCTAASMAGRAAKHLAKPEDDAVAGHLVAGFLAIVAAANPAVVVVENVTQYISSASFSILKTQLTEWGYDVQSSVLEGEKFGCIEHRNRMALVAVTEGINFTFENMPDDTSEPIPLADYLDDIQPDSPLWSPMTGLREKEVRDKAAGKGFRMQTYKGDAKKIGVITKGYAKIRGTDPKVEHPTDPSLLRQFTPAEHARIKGIPVELIKGVSATRAHEMLGQSILAKPFRALAATIGEALAAFIGRQFNPTPGKALATARAEIPRAARNYNPKSVPNQRAEPDFFDLPLFA